MTLTTGSDAYTVGTPSNATMTITDNDIAPNVPTNVTATLTGALSLNLTWNESSTGTIYYNIEQSTNGGTSWTSAATGITDHQLDGQLPGRQYQLHIPCQRLLHRRDYSAWSASSASVQTIPAAPSNLVATPDISHIDLVWTDPSPTTNITGYHIYRSTDNATWGSVYGTASGATATTFTDNSPGAGTAYYYQVKAYDSSTYNNGESATAAGMTCYVATVIAYEGFNYTPGSTFNGQNGGAGLLRLHGA